MTDPVFQGRYNSGETASSEQASITCEAAGLAIGGADGTQIAFWNYQDLTPAAPIARRANDVLLRNALNPRATLFIQGEGIGALIVGRAPQTAPGALRFRIAGRSLIATAIAAAAAAILFFGQFSVSKTVAGLIPGGVASRIGEQSIEMFGPIAPACVNQPGNAALQRILDRLQQGADYGRPFTLHVAQARIPNAFALPGRHIVLLSGLVRQAKNPEEVAGILAHEMGHGIEKDAEALFVRNVGMGALIELFTGQSGTQSPFMAGALLLQLRYSRAAERSADNHAIEILRNAGISPKPAGDFFLRDAAKEPGEDKVLSYLSTHPASKGRAQLFLSQPPYPVQPILSPKEWADAQAICGAPVKKPSTEPKRPVKPPSPPKPLPQKPAEKPQTINT